MIENATVGSKMYKPAPISLNVSKWYAPAGLDNEFVDRHYILSFNVG